MIRKLLTAALLLAASPSWAAVVAEYPLADNAANTVVDNTVGADGVLLGGDNTSAKTTVGPGGTITTGFDLNGTDDGIDMAAAAISFADNTTFSISAWVRLDGATGFITGNTGSTLTNRFSIQSDTVVRVRGSSATWNEWTVPSLGTGVWRHVMIVRDSGELVHVYVDGVESVEGGLAVDGSYTPNLIGKQSSSLFHDGALAMVRFYDSDETANVAAIYAEGVTAGPDHWYADTEATGANDGTSWEDAFTTLAALETAVNASSSPGDVVDLNAPLSNPFLGGWDIADATGMTIRHDEGADGETNYTNALAIDVTDAGSGIFTAVMAEPYRVIYDLQYDDLAGTMTGVTWATWMLDCMVAYGHDVADCPTPYGWLDEDTLTPTTPAEGMYGYSGGTLYVNPPGSPNEATVEAELLVCPDGVNGLEVSGDSVVVNGGKWWFYPGIAGNAGYAVKGNGITGSTFINGWQLVGGWHAFGWGTASGGDNQLINCVSVCTSGTTGHTQNTFVMAQADESLIWGGNCINCLCISFPEFKHPNGGAVAPPLYWDWSCVAGLSHAGDTVEFENIYYERLLAIDFTRSIELKHGQNNTKTTAPIALSHVDGTHDDPYDPATWPIRSSECCFIGNFTCMGGVWHQSAMFDRGNAGRLNMRHYDGDGVAGLIYNEDCTLISGSFGAVAGQVAELFDDIGVGDVVTIDGGQILLTAREDGADNAGAFGLTSDTGTAFAVVLKNGVRIDSDGGATQHGVLKEVSGGTVYANNFRDVTSDGTVLFGDGLETIAYNAAGSSLQPIAWWNSNITSGATDRQLFLTLGATVQDKADALRYQWLRSIFGNDQQSARYRRELMQ